LLLFLERKVERTAKEIKVTATECPGFEILDKEAKATIRRIPFQPLPGLRQSQKEQTFKYGLKNPNFKIQRPNEIQMS